jgi:pyrimidine deaminase RibD-like protein
MALERRMQATCPCSNGLSCALEQVTLFDSFIGSCLLLPALYRVLGEGAHEEHGAQRCEQDAVATKCYRPAADGCLLLV